MKEGKIESRLIEFYASKIRFWYILVLGIIMIFLGVKVLNIDFSEIRYTRGNFVASLLGMGSIFLIATIIEMSTLPKKMILKNLKKYVIIFSILFIVSLCIRYLQLRIYIKVSVMFCIVFGLIMVGYSLYRLIINRPSITLSGEGIRINSESNYNGIGIIKWNEIEEVFVYNNYFKRALGMKFYNMKEFKRKQNLFWKISNFGSGHVSILFSFLKEDNDYLEREFMRYFEEFKN